MRVSLVHQSIFFSLLPWDTHYWFWLNTPLTNSCTQNMVRCVTLINMVVDFGRGFHWSPNKNSLPIFFGIPSSICCQTLCPLDSKLYVESARVSLKPPRSSDIHYSLNTLSWRPRAEPIYYTHRASCKPTVINRATHVFKNSSLSRNDGKQKGKGEDWEGIGDEGSLVASKKQTVFFLLKTIAGSQAIWGPGICAMTH